MQLSTVELKTNSEVSRVIFVQSLAFRILPTVAGRQTYHSMLKNSQGTTVSHSKEPIAWLEVNLPLDGDVGAPEATADDGKVHIRSPLSVSPLDINLLVGFEGSGDGVVSTKAVIDCD